MQFRFPARVGKPSLMGAPIRAISPTILIRLSQSSVVATAIPAGEVRRTTINGMAAVGRTIRASASSSQVDATVFAYDLGGGKAYHFLLLTPAGRGQGSFASMVQSVTRITSQEAAAIKPRRISVVIVKAGDTVQSISRRMAIPTSTGALLTLNALIVQSVLKPGQRVKIIT